MADTSKQCTVTNNSSNDIVVVLHIDTNEKSSANAVTASNGRLEVLQTTDGGTTIKKGTADTVTLDHSYKPGADSSGYVQQYDLIISDSSWLYPLATRPVAQQAENGTTGYSAQTVATGDGAAMAQAVAFYQTVSVYPDSQLAKDYMAALQGANEAAAAKADGSAGSAAAVAAAIESTMASFFKSTTDYAQVTLADVVAVDTYYNTFPCVWAQYKDSLTYYLYGSNGTAALFAGTLSLQKNGAIDVTKPGGGYTCTFAPATNPADTSKWDVDASKAVNLTYANGVFTDDPVAANIGLKGGFLLQRRFTNKPDDTDVLTALVGKVAGVPVIGFDAPQVGRPSLQATPKLTQTDTDWNAFWDTLIHPKTQNDVIKSVAIFMSMVAAIPLAAGVVYGIYKLVKALKTPVTRDSLDTATDNRWTEDSESSDMCFGQYVTEGDRPTLRKVDFDAIARQDKLVEDHLAKGKLLEGLKMQRESIGGMLEFFDKMPVDQYVLLQSTLSDIKTASIALENATDDTVATVMKEQLTSFTTRQKSIGDIYTKIKTVLSKDAIAATEENMQLSDNTAKELTEKYDLEDKEETEIDPHTKKLIELFETF